MHNLSDDQIAIVVNDADRLAHGDLLTAQHSAEASFGDKAEQGLAIAEYLAFMAGFIAWYSLRTCDCHRIHIEQRAAEIAAMLETSYAPSAETVH